MTDPIEWNPQTRIVASGRPRATHEPLNAPIVVASTFGSAGDSPYSRDIGTDTWRAFEAFASDLEQADTVSFASGMAACAAVLAMAPNEARVAIPSDCYQGVAALAADAEADGRWTVHRIDTDDTARWVEVAATADLVWLESPSNPLLVIGDLATIGAAPRPASSLLVVDNTFATPLNQRPLDLGADVSVQSATKLLGGHSDLLSGLVATRRPDLGERLRRHRRLHGATPGALESYLALRGARTLSLRLEQSQRSAAVIAERLAQHAAVSIVRYPGLADHPGHEIAAAQLDGYGSMICFDLADGAAAEAACASTKLIRHATSLGGVESTMERRAGIPGQEHLPAGLIRMSVGIEHVEDVWADLDAAISR
ncbi:MAG: PLP-dependent aspartate aminotransferase family protein [Actinomycetota bacterium]